MPAKNALKIYLPNNYYHIYNRGVEKRIIFQEDRDYKIFLSYLRFYLTPPLPGLSWKYPSKQQNNFSGQLELLAYNLMPNHFHLLVYQQNPDTINHFMRSLCTKYVKQFNTHNDRVGPLFQGPYKAVLIENKDHLLYASKYIHLNSWSTSRTLLEMSQYSSYKNYLGIIIQTWVNPKPILSYLKKTKPKLDYQSYVENYTENPDDIVDWTIEPKKT
jgi:putative transposase